MLILNKLDQCIYMLKLVRYSASKYYACANTDYKEMLPFVFAAVDMTELMVSIVYL